MKQDKRVEGDLIVTEDEIMKSEEGFNEDSLIARINAKNKELEGKEKRPIHNRKPLADRDDDDYDSFPFGFLGENNLRSCILSVEELMRMKPGEVKSKQDANENTNYKCDKEGKAMMENCDYYDGEAPICTMNEPHMPVLLLIDISSSMSGQVIGNVEKAINRFASDICKDPKAAKVVDICVIAFNDSTCIVQDWSPISEMKSVEFTAGGGTNMSSALRLAVDILKERQHLYYMNSVEVRMPYLIMLTDGKGDNIDEISEVIRQRTAENKMKLWFLGVPGYDKKTAAMITEEERVFEIDDETGFDFVDALKEMVMSIRVSREDPGEVPKMLTNMAEENPLKKDVYGIKALNLDAWIP